MPTPTPATPQTSPLPWSSKLPSYLHVADVQGLSQLATQGVLGVAGLAETVQGSVYKSVAAPFGLLGSRFVDASPGSSGVRPDGITGFVYGAVRGVTRLTGGTVNAVLSKVVPLVGPQPSSPQREAVLSAINGVLGDHLLETANPLAISMSLRVAGQTLALDKTALAQRLPQAGGKILLLIHGLCMNDLQWGNNKNNKNNHGNSHAELLARELGYTPVYLHYNSGQHTSINGQQLAGLLDALLAAWPVPVQDLTLLVHSMGGLVARSACQQAELAGLAWRAQLKNIVFLGTPHHGAPLERIGNWVDTTLGSNLVTKPFARIAQIRSSGITDLRYGHVLEAHWLGRDRFQREPDTRQPLSLPEGVNCFAVAASTASQASALQEQLIGDGLVPVPSALGQHKDARLTLAFKPENQWLVYGVNHMALLSRPEVATQLLRWLGG